MSIIGTVIIWAVIVDKYGTTAVGWVLFAFYYFGFDFIEGRRVTCAPGNLSMAHL